ncbi:MAG: anthranilate phosphoribosyltransferase [Methanobacteriota archaeon]|nr:MAG: anthranilate phosphoribosyltransferase [Euryarchaeota archaeon]
MIRESIQLVVDGEDLPRDTAREVMDEIMSAMATPSQMASFITAVRMKGETRDELLGFALSMRERGIKVSAPRDAVDLCGTGGDGARTFNISTVASFVVSANGVPVAKHGNRAISSSSGSADVLSALGIPVDLDAGSVERCLSETGMGFMFAPGFHRSMRNVMATRREIGIRTFFNLLGPLLNPAGVRRQLVGVYDPSMAPLVAEVLAELGTEHAMVVHGQGMDEITNLGRTQVVELKHGETRTYQIAPGDLGVDIAEPEDLSGGSALDNARTMLSILRGERSARADVVAMNSAGALVVSGMASDLEEGVALARNALSSGAAFAKLERFSTVCADVEAESQLTCDVKQLRSRRVLPQTLKRRARDITDDLVSNISCSEEGKRILGNLDETLIRDPNVLSVLTMTRIKRVLQNQPRQAVSAARLGSKLSGAVASAEGIAVIGEYKPRSPSSPPLEVPPSVDRVADAYSGSGVAAVSVLAEEDFFGGGADVFMDMRSRVAMPMLFKDFVASEAQVDLASDLGADAVLLVAKALTRDSLDGLVRVSISNGMEPLVEVHDEVDLEKVSSCESYDSIDMIGVNGRNLSTLEVDIGHAVALRRQIDNGKTVIAESGVKRPSELARLHEFDAVLIGSMFMRAENLEQIVSETVASAAGVVG